MLTFDYNPKGSAEALSRARAAQGHVCNTGELVDMSGPGPFRCQPDSWSSIVRAYGNAFVIKDGKEASPQSTQRAQSGTEKNEGKDGAGVKTKTEKRKASESDQGTGTQK